MRVGATPAGVSAAGSKVVERGELTENAVWSHRSAATANQARARRPHNKAIFHIQPAIARTARFV